MTLLLSLALMLLPGHLADEAQTLAQGEIPAPYAELARCESGNWIDGGASFEGPIRWGYGAPGAFTHEGFEQYEGAFNFAPSTWDWVAGDLGIDHLWPHAYDAPPAVQVLVAAEVQHRQGWQAWPICSKKVLS